MAQDLFGRDTGNLDVKSMIGSLNDQVTKVLETKDVGAEAAMQKISEAVQELAAKIDANARKDAEEAESFADSVISSYKDIYKKQTSTNQKQSKLETVESRLSRKALERIVKMGSSPHTFWVGVGHFDNTAFGQLRRALSQSLQDCGLCGSGARIADAVNKAAKDTQQANSTNNATNATQQATGANMGGGPNGGGHGFNVTANRLQLLAYALSALATHLSQVFEVNLTDAFKGILIDSNRFRENIRAIIFQTQGFSETNRDMEKEFMNTYESVKQQGFNRATYEKIWQENLQRGFSYMGKIEKSGKNQIQILERQVKTQRSITTTALNAASALNMSAEGVNDVFMNWHMQLGMSSNELSQMGRSMKQISLSTGLTGTNLERAMKSSEDIMKSMRNSGNLTAASAKNVLSMMASAQKLGIEDTMGPFLKAMGGGRAMNEADEATKNLLNAFMTGTGSQYSGEMWKAVKSGDITKNKAQMKIGHQNIKDRAIQALENSGMTREKAEGIDLTQLDKIVKKMSSIEKIVLQENLASMGLKDVYTVQSMSKTLEENEKTEGEKRFDINKKIEKAKGPNGKETDASKALVRQKDEMETGNIGNVLSDITDSMVIEGKSFSAALSDVQKNLSGTFGKEYIEQLAGDPSKLQSSVKQMTDSLSSRAKNAGRDINEVTQRKGGMSIKDIQSAFKSGDATQIEKANQTLIDSMQEISKLESANVDPITKIRDEVILANTNLSEIARNLGILDNRFIFWLTKIAGTVAGIAGTLVYLEGLKSLLGISGGGMLNTAKGWLGSGGGMLNTAKGWLGMGGAGATGAAKSAMDLTKLAPFASGGDGIISKAPTSLEAWNAAFPKATGAATVGTESAITTGSKIMSFLAKWGGPLQLAIGGLTGALEAKSAGKSTIEGATLGALTGGAKTGSFLSGTLGVKKGSKTDKTLGVAGAAVWGAAAGAAIGTAFFGVGAAPGAAIGGIIGAGVELIKIFTEGSSVVGIIWGGIKAIATGIYNIFAGILGIVKSIFSGIWEAIKYVGSGIWNGIKYIGAGVWTGIKAIGSGIWSALQAIGIIDIFNEVFGELWSSIKELGTGLYDVFSEIWKLLKELGTAIYETFYGTWILIGEAFGELYKAIEPIGTEINKFFGGIGTAINETFSGFGILFGEAFGEGTKFMDVVKGIAKALAQTIGFLVKLVLWPIMLVAKVLGGIGKIIQAIVKVFKGDFTGADKLILSAWTGVLDGLLYPFEGILSFFNKFGATIWSYITAPFNAMYKFFSNFNLLGSLANIGSCLYKTIIGGMAGLGDWIYKNTVGAIMNRIPDWVKNLVVGGAANVAGNVGGAANVAGNVGGAANVAGNVGGAIMGPIGTAKSALSTIGGAVMGSAVLDWINPFNYFQEGTKSVQQPGLAVLHQGEMVVPKEEVKAITAIGNGPFGSASAFNSGAFEGGQAKEALETGLSQKTSEMMASMIDMINPFSAMQKLFSGSEKTDQKADDVAERLIDALYCVCNSSSESYASGGMGLGLFDPVNIFDAMQDGVTNMISTMINPIGALESMFGAISKPLGLGGGESIFTKLTNAFTTKSNSDRSNNTVADSGKAMYYSDIMGAINQSPLGGVVDALMQSPAAQALETIFGKAEASSNIIDYSDQTRATASPSSMNMFDAENRVAQERYGSMPSGGVIPGMENIEDHLAQENNMSRKMIEILEKIERNTESKTKRSTVVGSQSNGRPPNGGNKMRKISQELSTGEWDITFGDYSPSSITT